MIKIPRKPETAPEMMATTYYKTFITHWDQFWTIKSLKDQYTEEISILEVDVNHAIVKLRSANATPEQGEKAKDKVRSLISEQLELERTMRSKSCEEYSRDFESRQTRLLHTMREAMLDIMNDSDVSINVHAADDDTSVEPESDGQVSHHRHSPVPDYSFHGSDDDQRLSPGSEDGTAGSTAEEPRTVKRMMPDSPASRAQKRARLLPDSPPPPRQETIPFGDVYQDGNTREIVSPHQKAWYVIRCNEHNLQVKANPLSTGTAHLRGSHHNIPSATKIDAIEKLGIQVQNCNGGLAVKNNLAARTTLGIEKARELKERRRHKLARLRAGRPARTSIRRIREASVQRHASIGIRRAIARRMTPTTQAARKIKVNPKPGDVYETFYKKANAKIPVLILPASSMERIGVNADLETWNLADEHLPECYVFREEAGQFEWAEGYEDNGEHAGSRSYPALCLTSYSKERFPEGGSSAMWVLAKDLEPFDPDSDNAKLSNYYSCARQILRRTEQVRDGIRRGDRSSASAIDGEESSAEEMEQSVASDERETTVTSSVPHGEADVDLSVASEHESEAAMPRLSSNNQEGRVERAITISSDESDAPNYSPRECTHSSERDCVPPAPVASQHDGARGDSTSSRSSSSSTMDDGSTQPDSVPRSASPSPQSLTPSSADIPRQLLETTPSAVFEEDVPAAAKPANNFEDSGLGDCSPSGASRSSGSFHYSGQGSSDTSGDDKPQFSEDDVSDGFRALVDDLSTESTRYPVPHTRMSASLECEPSPSLSQTTVPAPDQKASTGEPARNAVESAAELRREASVASSSAKQLSPREEPSEESRQPSPRNFYPENAYPQEYQLGRQSQDPRPTGSARQQTAAVHPSEEPSRVHDNNGREMAPAQTEPYSLPLGSTNRKPLPTQANRVPVMDSSRREHRASNFSPPFSPRPREASEVPRYTDQRRNNHPTPSPAARTTHSARKPSDSSSEASSPARPSPPQQQQQQQKPRTPAVRDAKRTKTQRYTPRSVPAPSARANQSGPSRQFSEKFGGGGGSSRQAVDHNDLNLVRHMDGKGGFSCQRCRSAFSRRDSFANHLETQHPEEFRTLVAENRKRRYSGGTTR